MGGGGKHGRGAIYLPPRVGCVLPECLRGFAMSIFVVFVVVDCRQRARGGAKHRGGGGISEKTALLCRVWIGYPRLFV